MNNLKKLIKKSALLVVSSSVFFISNTFAAEGLFIGSRYETFPPYPGPDNISNTGFGQQVTDQTYIGHLYFYDFSTQSFRTILGDTNQEKGAFTGMSYDPNTSRIYYVDSVNFQNLPRVGYTDPDGTVDELLYSYSALNLSLNDDGTEIYLVRAQSQERAGTQLPGTITTIPGSNLSPIAPTTINSSAGNAYDAATGYLYYNDNRNHSTQEDRILRINLISGGDAQVVLRMPYLTGATYYNGMVIDPVSRKLYMTIGSEYDLAQEPVFAGMLAFELPAEDSTAINENSPQIDTAFTNQAVAGTGVSFPVIEHGHTSSIAIDSASRTLYFSSRVDKASKLHHPSGDLFPNDLRGEHILFSLDLNDPNASPVRLAKLPVPAGSMAYFSDSQPPTCLNKLIVSSDKTIVTAGEQFTVTLDLDIDSATELYTLQASLPYDDNLLELVSSSYTTGSGSFFDSANRFDVTPIETAGSWTGAVSLHDNDPSVQETGRNGTGSFATLTFRVKDTVTTAGETTLGADDGSTLFSLKPTLGSEDISGGLCVEDNCVEPFTITIDAGTASLDAILEKPVYLCDAPVVPHDLSGSSVTLVNQTTGFTRTTTTDAAGAFSFGNLPAGDYDLFAQGGSYILPCQTVTLVDATATDLGNTAMLAGDIDGNGTIEAADKDVLVSNLLGSDAASDLNNDGSVNAFDLAVLSANVGNTIICN